MAKEVRSTAGQPITARPNIGRIPVYDPTGVKRMVFPVDADEIITAGGSYDPPAEEHQDGGQTSDTQENSGQEETEAEAQGHTVSGRARARR